MEQPCIQRADCKSYADLGSASLASSLFKGQLHQRFYVSLVIIPKKKPVVDKKDKMKESMYTTTKIIKFQRKTEESKKRKRNHRIVKNIYIYINYYIISRGRKLEGGGIPMALMLGMVSWVYTYPQTHWILYVTYVQLFTYQSYLNKIVTKRKYI